MAAGEFGKLSCDKCQRDPRLKEAWTCEAIPDAKEPVYCILPGDPVWETKLARCPLRDLDHTILGTLDLYWHWRDGRMPVAGGVLDQSASFLEAVRFLDKAFDLAGVKRGRQSNA